MTVESDADRATLIADFGEWASVAGEWVKGIFDRDYVESGAVSGEHPVLLCATKDVEHASAGDVVTVNDTDYTLRVPQPDGTGFTMLILEEQ